MAIVVVAVVFSGVLTAYIQTTTRAQWSGYSLAAQSLAIQQVEQARSAVWDLYSGANEIIDMPLIDKRVTAGGRSITGYMTNVLDIPYNTRVGLGANFVWATNYVTIQEINPRFNDQAGQAVVRLIRVDTVWAFTWNNTCRLYTNTICTYAAPDN